MLRRVFLVFLLILLSDAIFSGAASTQKSDKTRVILFEQGVTTVPFEDDDGKITDRKVHSFRIPSLVDVDGVMVAIADARYPSASDNTFIETVVKYSVDNGKTWDTQIAIKNTRVSSVSRVVDPTVIVKGNKIYVLVGSFNKSTNYWHQHLDGSDWDPLISVGEVTKTNTKDGVKATITWTTPVSIKSVFPKTIAGAQSKEFLGGVGVAIVTAKGALVFPVQATNHNKDVTSTIMYSLDDGKTWKFANGITALGCTESSVLEFDGKLIMNSRTDLRYRMVFESTDMGETWAEAVGTLSRVWGNSPTRKAPGSQSPFISVTIEGKPVMLFAHPLNYKGWWQRDRLHLWVTDNNRIFDVGQISVGDENAAYSSLLYKDGKLYCLHETNDKGAYSLVFLELKEELDLIKSVVKTWIDQDKKFSDICTPTDSKEVPRASVCGPPFPTVGLVGFLSNASHGVHWKDAYRSVDANATKATKFGNGMIFNGVGAGARWPVSKQGQNQRYHFSNYMFTLVATVKMGTLPKGGNTAPLLGVSLDDVGNRKLLGLSFDTDQKWRPIYGEVEAAATGSWNLRDTYQVALTFQDEVGTIYVDGEPLAGPGGKVEYDTESPDVSHFYIGGHGGAELKTNAQVSVSNVLLYNRKLNQSELKTLFLARDKIAEDPSGNSSNDSFPDDLEQTAEPEKDGSTLSFGVGCFSLMLLPLMALAFLLFDHDIFLS